MKHKKFLTLFTSFSILWIVAVSCLGSKNIPIATVAPHLSLPTPRRIIPSPTALPLPTQTPLPDIPTQTQPSNANAPSPLPSAVVLGTEKFSILSSFAAGFYKPENGSYLEVSVTYFGPVSEVSSQDLKICALIEEYRQYQSGQIVKTPLTQECRQAVFVSSHETISDAKATFTFKPSGYSFVWIGAEPDRYQITKIQATASLLQGEKSLKSTSASHRLAPVRVERAWLENGQTAKAQLRFEAGQGESYNIKISVYQIETDPDEVGVSALLFFLPCLLPDVCDDRTLAGEMVYPVELMAGTTRVISTDYHTVPVKEQGNTIQGYGVYVFFEDILLYSSK
ncbi:MAG: hypothetical protein ACK44E_12195 [Anaerolineales bacterium]